MSSAAHSSEKKSSQEEEDAQLFEERLCELVINSVRMQGETGSTEQLGVIGGAEKKKWRAVGDRLPLLDALINTLPL